jgi:exodeoxyribonuclease VII large subunit
VPEPPPVQPDVPPEVYTVSRLNLEARNVLEGHFETLWVEGEISNLARPRSGHIYFSLKDEHCQVRCAMFRMQNRRLDFGPADGMQVLVCGRVGIYPERGEFQLVAQYMEEAGAGALRRAYEALKRRLADEGLFDERHKRPLPPLPRCIGVVTSPTGAAVRDVLSVLRRRFAAIPIVVYPVPVQGEGAARRIAEMLDRAGERAECDVLILTRGGGSLEDLWAFNEEPVARALRRCPIPVVTGIGHEVDFTIADLAADRRAPTPSAAAELVSPDQGELRERLAGLARRIERQTRAAMAERERRVEYLTRRLVHPRRRLGDLSQRLDGLRARLMRAAQAVPRLCAATLAARRAALGRQNPALRLREHRTRLDRARHALDQSARRLTETRRARLAGLSRALAAVGPAGTLERGYAIVVRAEDGTVVRDPREVDPGDQVRARLARGELLAVVERTMPHDPGD